MSAKRDLEEYRAALRKVESAHAQTEARLKVAEEEFQSSKRAIKDMGFKSIKELNAAETEDSERDEELCLQLDELLKDFL